MNEELKNKIKSNGLILMNNVKPIILGFKKDEETGNRVAICRKRYYDTKVEPEDIEVDRYIHIRIKGEWKILREEDYNKLWREEMRYKVVVYKNQEMLEEHYYDNYEDAELKEQVLNCKYIQGELKGYETILRRADIIFGGKYEQGEDTYYIAIVRA